MKPQRVCDIGQGPDSCLPHGAGAETLRHARETLARLNGGLPPNLGMWSRIALIKLIHQLHRELQAIRNP